MTLSAVSPYDRSAVPTLGAHAVVVGGSMAGLLSARVLADAYDRVTLLERDSLPDDPVARRGVPQAAHVHVLLEAGRHVLRELFPGFQSELRSAGGVVMDAATELTYYEQGTPLADVRAEMPMCCASRPLFEFLVRRRVTDTDGVVIRPECHFTDYLTDADATAVEGVAFVNEAGDEETLAADLVVDATGRTSRTPRWLADHGYPSPPVDRVDVDLAYSTVAVERPPGDTRAFLVAPSPPRTHGGTAVPVEDGRWLVTLFGMHGSHPPTGRDSPRSPTSFRRRRSRRCSATVAGARRTSATTRSRPTGGGITRSCRRSPTGSS
jgi:flavin-dependent dehydrogenase